MAIICSSYSTTISGSNSLVCGYVIRIYDINPPLESINILVDNVEIVGVSGYRGHLYGNVILSLHFVSKNTTDNTAVIDMVVSDNPCIGVSCPDICVGTDLYSQRCSIEWDSQLIPTGSTTCVLDVPKTPNTCSPAPTATHYIDYDFSILPQSFLDLVSSNIVDLSNWLGTHLPMPSNIQWVSASYSTGKLRSYIIYTPPLPSASLEQIQSLVSLPAMAIGTFAGIWAGLKVFAVAQRLTAVAGPIWSTVIGAALGIVAATSLGFVITEISSGILTPGTAPPQTSLDKSKNIDDYIKNYVIPFCNSQHPGCAAVPATCDQATYRVYAACIQQVAQCQYDAAMKGDPVTTCDPRVQEYTAIDTGLADGTMTVAEAQQRTTTNNTTINNYHNEVINTLLAEEAAADAGDCWIAGFVPGTCMLTAKTGKTIAIIGGVVIGGVILISLFKK